MPKTIEEINEKIRRGDAVVVNAEEIIDIVRARGVKAAAAQVDVVTTGTFGPMCSSGAYLNVGHTSPRIKLGGGRVRLNGVPVHAGFAAVDIQIGATSVHEDDPLNSEHPGAFRYGGGHVIEDLAAGRDVRLEAECHGTDCYPRTSLDTLINIRDVNEAVLFNMRNAYQNYNCAVNNSGRTLYTYLGVLRPRLGNAHYCSAGQLSPLLNDPNYRTIGVGTRIFLGGGVGYVAWHGTQHNPCAPRGENGVPSGGAGTLAVIGDLKQMKPRYLKGVSFRGYGCTLAVGIGVPIPLLDEDVCAAAAVTDADIKAQVVDYSDAYPNRKAESLAEVTYAELRSGRITVLGKDVPSTALSSYARALEIADKLKRWIQLGKFELTEYVQPLPDVSSGYTPKALVERRTIRMT